MGVAMSESIDYSFNMAKLVYFYNEDYIQQSIQQNIQFNLYLRLTLWSLQNRCPRLLNMTTDFKFLTELLFLLHLTYMKNYHFVKAKMLLPLFCNLMFVKKDTLKTFTLPLLYCNILKKYLFDMGLLFMLNSSINTLHLTVKFGTE